MVNPKKGQGVKRTRVTWSPPPGFSTLGLSTLLPVNQTYAYTTTAPNSRIKQSGYYKQWWLSVSVTYKFGSLKSNVKQTRVKLDNNDISTGGGNKGGRN